MALTDINFQESEGQDFLVELPSASYSGSLTDVVIESSSEAYILNEIPEQTGGGGNIFIMSE